MSDFWRMIATTLGMVFAITILVCLWAIVIAFTLKVVWLIGFGMFG